jgi:hypothetical protein
MSRGYANLSKVSKLFGMLQGRSTPSCHSTRYLAVNASLSSRGKLVITLILLRIGETPLNWGLLVVLYQPSGITVQDLGVT